MGRQVRKNEFLADLAIPDTVRFADITRYS